MAAAPRSRRPAGGRLPLTILPVRQRRWFRLGQATCTIALLVLSGTPGSRADEASSFRFALPPEAGAAHFEIETSRRDSHARRAGGLMEDWRDQFGFMADIAAGGVEVEIDGAFADFGRASTMESDSELFEEDIGHFERNTVNETGVTLGLSDDRLRLSSRQAWSSYDASSFAVRRRAFELRGRPDPEAQEPQAAADGRAVGHRFDAALLRSDTANLSVFGLWSEVGRNFEAFELRDDDAFGRSNRETLEVGGKLGLGPLVFEFTQSRFERLDDAEAAPEDRTEVTLSLDLNRLGTMFDGVPARLKTLAPDTVWATLGRGRIDARHGSSASDDRIEDVAFGLVWDWDGAYASLDYWDSVYDGGEQGDVAFDWIGRGGSTAFGFYDERWSMDAALGFYQADALDAFGGTRESGYDGTLTLKLKPESIPDLLASFYAGKYATVSPGFDAASGTTVVQVGTALDFSKFVTQRFPEGDLSLRLVYRFGNEYTRADPGGSERRQDHTLLLLFKLKRPVERFGDYDLGRESLDFVTPARRHFE